MLKIFFVLILIRIGNQSRKREIEEATQRFLYVNILVINRNKPKKVKT